MNNAKLNKEFLNSYNYDFKVNTLNDIASYMCKSVEDVERIILNDNPQIILNYIPEYKKETYNIMFNSFILKYITMLENKIYMLEDKIEYIDETNFLKRVYNGVHNTNY
jgi:hypothetical protein